jgi:4-diphosphocytidyl-2-C-methyl-D-erythritol kinase
MSVRVFAPAKVNLTLKVGRPRADGLHPLQSVVVFADVGDWVEAGPADDLHLRIVGPFANSLVGDENNLVTRAARALAQAAGLSRPAAALVLTKNLPVASGIGGGSADAAATLRALNALWSLGWPDEKLAELGRTLGADVPACVGSRAAFVSGIGEAITAMDLPILHAVLVNPMRPLGTGEVFGKFDRMGLGATFEERPSPVWSNAAEVVAGARSIGNDLEAPAIALLPEISGIGGALRRDPRVRYAALSGSGATLFALVDDGAAAAAVAHDVQLANPAYWVREALFGAA